MRHSLVLALVVSFLGCGGGGEEDEGRRLGEGSSIHLKAEIRLTRESGQLEIVVQPDFLPAEGCALGKKAKAYLNGVSLGAVSRGAKAEDGSCAPARFAGSFTPRLESEDDGHRDSIVVEDPSHRIEMEVRDATTRGIFGVAGFSLPRGSESWFFVRMANDDLDRAHLELSFLGPETSFTVPNDALHRAPVAAGRTRIDFRVPKDAPPGEGRFRLNAWGIPLEVLRCEAAACEAQLEASLLGPHDHETF